MFRILSFVFALAASTAAAGSSDKVIDQTILPGFEALAKSAERLEQAALSDCRATSEPLRQAFGDTFDAWTALSHLRFGPTETDNRGFALAFWPDSRGKTPRALNSLIAAEDPAVNDPEEFATVSIAARGLYALEFLIFDDAISSAGTESYRCALIRAITDDIATVTQSIALEWRTSYAAQMRNPSANGLYQSEQEVAQELFKALNTGLQLTADMRLGRPLGTFDKPRPKRAEVWRSGRSLHHVIVALESLEQLAAQLAEADPDIAAHLKERFDLALAEAQLLDDPTFAGVATPVGRLRVEVLQRTVHDIQTVVAQELGPMLGVSAGFNSLDGD